MFGIFIWYFHLCYFHFLTFAFVQFIMSVNFDVSLDNELPFRKNSDSDNEENELSLAEMGYDASTAKPSAAFIEHSLFKMICRSVVKKKLTDFKVKTGPVIFKCHIILLHYYSDYFKEYKRGEFVELPEKIVSPIGFSLVYEWMLSPEKVLHRHNIIDTFITADFLIIPKLMEQCWLYFSEEFNEERAFMLVLEIGPRHNMLLLHDLREMLIRTISKFFLTIVASSDFLLLNAKTVCLLLSSNTLGVNSEIEILMSAVRWLNFNWQARKEHTDRLLNYVKFSSMPLLFLHDFLNDQPECIEMENVLRDTYVDKTIKKALSYKYNKLPFKGLNQALSLVHEAKKLEPLAPLKREWIYDSQCKYHKIYPNISSLTYKDFLNYMDTLRKGESYRWRYFGSICKQNYLKSDI